MSKIRTTRSLKPDSRAPCFESSEEHFSASLDQLDQLQPDWDKDQRIEGAIRRLNRDPSSNGIELAKVVFGELIVAEAVKRISWEKSVSLMPSANKDEAVTLSAIDFIKTSPLPAETMVAIQNGAIIINGTNNSHNYKKLTRRESEILHLVSLGKKITDIAKALNLNSFTIKVHYRRILDKVMYSEHEQVVENAEHTALATEIAMQLEHNDKR